MKSFKAEALSALTNLLIETIEPSTPSSTCEDKESYSRTEVALIMQGAIAACMNTIAELDEELPDIPKTEYRLPNARPYYDYYGYGVKGKTWNEKETEDEA